MLDIRLTFIQFTQTIKCYKSELADKQTDRQTDRHPFNSLFSRTTWVSQNQNG